MSQLQITNMNAYLGRTHVLKDLTMTAEAGHLTAIVGPNGSGKSTTLKAITGEIPYNGQITLNTREVADTSAQDMAAIRAVLPQATPMSFPFQVIEVVRLGALMRTPATDRLAMEALHKVGLAGYETRYYQELSGGEQQRAQLARVLCQAWQHDATLEAGWLFLDEPVSSLDIAHQLHVMKIAREFANTGGGVVAVMHDLNLSAMFADRIVILKAGQIKAQGRVDETLTNDILSDVYGCAIQTERPPNPPGWYFLPQSASLQSPSGPIG